MLMGRGVCIVSHWRVVGGLCACTRAGRLFIQDSYRQLVKLIVVSCVARKPLGLKKRAWSGRFCACHARRFCPVLAFFASRWWC